MESIVDAIKLALREEKPNELMATFFARWLSDEPKTEEDRLILTKLAKERVYPNTGYCNLFRGCRIARDGSAESYSTSITEASRFAGDKGYIVAIDTNRYSFYTFDVTGYVFKVLGSLLEDCTDEDYARYEELINLAESCSGEDEVIVITDLERSVILKVESKGSEL